MIRELLGKASVPAVVAQQRRWFAGDQKTVLTYRDSHHLAIRSIHLPIIVKDHMTPRPSSPTQAASCPRFVLSCRGARPLAGRTCGLMLALDQLVQQVQKPGVAAVVDVIDVPQA